MDLVLSPDAIKLRLDPHLKPSHDIYEELNRNVCQTEPKSWNDVLRQVPLFPSAYQLLLMAKAAYKDFKQGESMQDYETRVNLPKGWNLLTIAKNNALGNGYFGAAYLNTSSSQVVIAHRGTKFSKMGAVWSDVKGILNNNYISQMNSACTFANLVLTSIRRIEQERKSLRFEVFITGHSLGGWLSQVTTFSLKFLSPVDSKFKKHSNSELECHAHAVVFDSPGCKDMLVKMVDTFQVRYGDRPLSLDTLDITTYLSAPNMVNCCNSHVGSIIRIFPDLTKVKSMHYSIKSHSSKMILSTFDADTGQVRTDLTGEPKMQRVVDWPIMLETSEYNDFFKWAKKLNNYSPDTSSTEYEAEIRKRLGFCPIRYQTTKYKNTQRNCAIFTQNEREFLEKYQWLRELPDHFKERVLFDDKNKDNEEYIIQKMQCFTVRKNNINCRSGDELDTFIPFVKVVLQFYPNCVSNVMKVLSSMQAAKRIYEIESEFYSRHLEKWSVQLTGMDLPNITDFIRSVQSKLINVVVNDDHTDVTSARIHNAIQRQHKAEVSTYMVLELQNLLIINKTVGFKKIFSSDNLGNTLVVIECNSKIKSSNELTNLLEDIVSVFKNRSCIKIIMVTKIDSLSSEMVYCSFTLQDKFVKVEDNGLNLTHLTVEGKREILSKNVVMFQGQLEPIALKTYFSEEEVATWKAILDSETITKLVKGEKLFIGPNVSDLDECSGYYVTRSFVDERENCDNIYNESEFFNLLNKSKVHVISDKAGMGKTTVITNLALNLKKKRPQLWIIRLNLNDCTNVLRDKLAQRNKENASDTLIDLMESHTKTKLLTTFEKNLLTRALMVSGKVTLFLDGFDEISPNYEDLIIDFLRLLVDCKLQNIIIATRPHTKRKLQTQLQPKTHTMTAFSKEDQKKFFVRFWQQTLGDKHHGLNLEKYSEDLIEKLSSAINDNAREFTGIPLQCRLVAEVFQDCLFKGELPLPDQLNLIELYDTFVTKKLEIYENEKTFDTQGQVSVLLDRKIANLAMLHYHWQLALQLILSEEGFETLGLSKTDNEILEIKALKVGLLLRGGQTPQFIHRTLAEYFVADFFAANLETINSVKLLVTEVLLHPQYRVVRSFLNGKLKGIKSELFGKHLAELFISERERLFDFMDEPAIFILVKEKLEDLLIFVLNSCALGKENIEVLLPYITGRNAKGETPLYYGIEYANEDFNSHFFKILSSCSLKVKRTLLLSSAFANANPVNNVQVVALLGQAFKHPAFHDVVKNMTTKFGLIPLFLDAAKRGSVQDLRRLLENAGDDETRYYLLRSYERDYSSIFLNSALHLTTERGHVQATKFLIDNGAPVDYYSFANNRNASCKWTPLIIAVNAGNEVIVNMILENDIAIKPNDMCLKVAAMKNTDSIYRSIFSKMTGLNLGTIKGLVYPRFHKQNMLLWSMRRNLRKRDLLNALKMVTEEKLADAVSDMLERGSNVFKPDEDGEFPIHWAIKTEREDVVSSLVEMGSKINTRNTINGETPLMMAAQTNQKQMVQLLLRKEADVNSCGDTGNTALHFSAWKGHEDVIKILLENKANIHAVNNYDQTALHTAAREGHSAAVIALLEKGAIIEAKGQNKMSALHQASSHGHVDTVKVLLEEGANIMAVDNDSRTTLHIACRYGHGNVASLLIEEGADCNAYNAQLETPLHEAASKGDVSVARVLLEHSADPNATSSLGFGALGTAALFGHTEIVIALLEYGASVNAANDNGTTSLHFASMYGRTDVVQILVQSGANINAVDGKGDTALHNAVKINLKEMVLFLIKNGANCKAANKNNETPLDIAMQEGKLELCLLMSSDDFFRHPA